jgi:hypothetical protein
MSGVPATPDLILERPPPNEAASLRDDEAYGLVVIDQGATVFAPVLVE